ncbi:hypothetical protein HanRHA438_Chr02g0087001 [Helianthus annuus]|nr:hypothetical protein HanRHA438_Chr02g0087001 [Helianthus annuus]
MKYNSLKHNTFIPFQQYPFYPNPPHPIFGRPTKPQNFISNFKSRALFRFRFLSPSNICIWIWIGCAISSQFTTSYAGGRFDLLKDQDHDQLRPWYNDEEDEDDVDGELCIRDSEQALTLDFNNVIQARFCTIVLLHGFCLHEF